MRNIERRLAAMEAAVLPAPAERPGAALERLLRRLDALSRRLREAPDWREPTPEEGAAARAEIVAHFRDRFGEATAERVAAALAGADR